MKSILLVSFLTLTLSLSAATQPTVTAITPSSGPDVGGTAVRITGSHLNPTVVCALPCPPRVTFGNVTVDAINESDSALVTTTPPHPAGTVDITVAIPGEEPVVLRDGFTFTETAQSAYEQVLLPVYINGTIDGASGTRWATDFWLRNDGTESVLLAPWTCPVDHACGGVFPLTFALDPQLALHNPANLASNGRTNPSQLLYVFKTPSPSVSMNLRVADLSRSDLNAGTNIPVVRERDFLTGNAQLLNVPLDRSSRALLRIYDMTFSSAPYLITVYRQSEGIEQPASTVYVLASTPQEGAFRNEAAYAQVDLSGLLHTEGIARIEVHPANPASRYWAFASITNNQTQLVTLVTP